MNIWCNSQGAKSLQLTPQEAGTSSSSGYSCRIVVVLGDQRAGSERQADVLRKISEDVKVTDDTWLASKPQE